MGGSGAGKTSLISALCGRAFYGKITGDVKINGHDKTPEESTYLVGFVPSDDIMYSELTVEVNITFAGNFQLPAGTSMSKIKALVYDIMEKLGMVHVANTIVVEISIYYPLIRK
jgi:ABC-type multidrug transport system ATPase subunit